VVAEDHKITTIENRVRIEHLKSELKRAIKEDKPSDIANIREKLKVLAEEEEPTEKRYTTSDATVEKLGELLRDNPNGLLNVRDELMGWLATLDRGGHEGDRAFFLEAWDGKHAYHVDRIGRGSVHVPALCLSIFGGIQPGPLSRYVQDALTESVKADGLLQRFQVLVWPDPRPYVRSDEAPDPETRDAVFSIFKTLATLDARKFGAHITDTDELPYIHFTDSAQAVYNEWQDEFEPRVQSGSYPAALEAHLLKFKSLFPSLALVFELIDFATSSEKHRKKREGVGELAAMRAASWCQWLESHAMRLYHPAIIAPTLAARSLLEHIEAEDVEHNMKTRDIWRRGWRDLSTAAELAGAIEVLEDHGWVRRVTVKPTGGGRPSERLHIHPSLRNAS
jgi:hypothetical protein